MNVIVEKVKASHVHSEQNYAEQKMFGSHTYLAACEVIFVDEKNSVDRIGFRDVIHEIPAAEVEAELAVGRGLLVNAEGNNHFGGKAGVKFRLVWLQAVAAKENVYSGIFIIGCRYKT